MDLGLIPKPVHITTKAANYANNSRAHLHDFEIVRLIQEKRGVYLGSVHNVAFLLVWDHRKHTPIVLLVSSEAKQDVVVSIWEPHYIGIPHGLPTASQMWQALELSLQE